MEVLEEWQEREGIYACFLATLPDPREGGGGGSSPPGLHSAVCAAYPNETRVLFLLAAEASAG